MGVNVFPTISLFRLQWLPLPLGLIFLVKAYNFTSCTTEIDCSPIGVIELYVLFTYVLLFPREEGASAVEG
jgi:hypothetical protein